MLRPSLRNGAIRGLLALLAVTATAPALAHGDWPPKHGGLMNDGETSFELVARDGRVTLYLEDHGTPIATAGAVGTLTVTRSGSDRVVELRPAGANRLQTSGPAKPARGNSVVARVTLHNGSVVVGRFVMP